MNYVNANAYSVNIIRVLKLNKKTAYILNNNTSGNFNTNDLEIFTQDGYLIKNGNEKKLNTPDNFTLENNGGLKNIMFVGNKVFALLSAKKDKCFLGKIYNISENKNFIDLGCLPDRDNTDFNGLGSSVVYLNNKLLLSVGTVDANLTLNSETSKFNIKGSSYSGEASLDNVIGNWWSHRILQANSQISPLSGSIKEQLVTFVGKEKIILNGKEYNTDHFKLTSKDMTLPDDKKLDFDIWLDKKNSLIVKITYKRMGNWEYRLKHFE